MKQYWRVVGLLLTAWVSTCASQTSNATATITDPDGQTWNNGNVQATLVVPPGTVGVPVWSGGNPFPTKFSATMNAAGTFIVSLPDNAFITPPGTRWQFTLCSNTSAPCQNAITTVTGASPNLSTALSTPLAAPRFGTGPFAFGYSDVEVITPIATGSSYFNVSTQANRQWNGSIWTAATAVTGGFWSFGSESPYLPNISQSAATVTASANQVFVFQITLHSSITINKMVYEIGAGGTDTLGFGFYDSTCSTLLGSQTVVNPVGTNAIASTTWTTPLTLAAGTYFFAQTSSTATATIVFWVISSSSPPVITMVNTNRNRTGLAANVSAAGVLPASCGAISTATTRSPMLLWIEN